MDAIQLALLRAERGEPNRSLIAPGNIDLTNRPIVRNPDGSYSTVASFSRENDQGQEVLVPQVVGGRMRSQDWAWEHYLRTGQQLGVFRDPRSANLYANLLHQQQA